MRLTHNVGIRPPESAFLDLFAAIEGAGVVVPDLAGKYAIERITALSQNNAATRIYRVTVSRAGRLP